MTFRRRLRVLWAAWTQEWRQEICHNCGDTWWTQTTALPSGMWCQTCEDEHFEQWRQEFEARASGRKEIA